MLGNRYAYQNAGKNKSSHAAHPLTKPTADKLEELASARTMSGFLSHPLASYSKVRTYSIRSTPLLTYHKSKGFPETNLHVISSRSTNGQAWHLTSPTAEGVEEELVFTIQGIILQCDLPPIVRPFPRSVSPIHLQQRILLSGFNTTTFADALQGLNHVDNILRLNVRDDSPPKSTPHKYGYPSIEITNRYFTSKRLANEEDHIGIPLDIDPNGILEGLRGDSLVYTADNAVQYYQRQLVNGGQQFKPVKPAHIKKGDIVEVQLTVTLVESRTGKGKNTRHQYLTRLVLRSITQLDSTYSDACRLASSQPPPRPNLKRKIGHDEEEAMETQERMKRMAVDPFGDSQGIFTTH
ncbi:hypothetical protein VNI00_018281 [Paramarasmius palmivorus]|uniref:Uncharacterized protein n=1 Tax=Paramarasmius palmivorus TaxID=297713 RepID=A0AAW0B2J7_9AGAR